MSKDKVNLDRSLRTSYRSKELGRMHSIPDSLDAVDVDLSLIKPGEDFTISVDPRRLAVLRDEVMLESALIQWIATRWRRASADDAFQVTLDDEKNKDQLLNQLAVSVPGAVLAILPAGKLQRIDRRTSATFRQQFFNLQSRWPDLAKFDSARLLCADFYSRGLPSKLYADVETGQVTDWEGYRRIVDGLVNSVVEASSIGSQIRKRTDEISTIFFELFKNTHVHARIGVDGQVIGDSIRGIYSRFYPIESLRVSTSEEQTQEMTPVDRYLHALIYPISDPQRNRVMSQTISGFLELSVFDTGPGLAAKWLGREISGCDAKEQYEAVTRCFGKGYSSSLESGRGFGLWRVLQELRRLKGFIRIRTNQIHAYRQYAWIEDLLTERHYDGHATPKEKLLDWKRHLATSPSEYPAVEGTLISILLPLGDL